MSVFAGVGRGRQPGQQRVDAGIAHPVPPTQVIEPSASQICQFFRHILSYSVICVDGTSTLNRGCALAEKGFSFQNTRIKCPAAGQVVNVRQPRPGQTPRRLTTALTAGRMDLAGKVK